MASTPRRTCPSCARRYAGLVSPTCTVCRGLGTLALGAAALAHYEPAAIARAIELYLESIAQRTLHELPLGQRATAIETAVDELRIAGVLASTADAAGTPATPPAPQNTTALRVTELNAYRATRDLGEPPTPRITNTLAAPRHPDLTNARPRDGRTPTASANADPTALATITDPIDPLGPDTADLDATRNANTYRARVIAAAIPHTIRARRSNTP